MVRDQFTFLCFLLALGLGAARFNSSNFNPATLRRPSVRPFGWDPDFCNDWQDMDAFPHPDSCKEYLICWDGELWEQTCDPGMLFDRWDGVCDWAEFVDCDDDPVDLPDDECPPPGSSEVRFLPSEYCDEFYICINGQPILLFCRPGQHWNMEREFCDYPANAGCKTKDNPEELPNCPSAFTGQLPHPHNCNWFIHCNNGNRSIQQCQHLHHFDVTTQRCVFQTAARCIKHARN